MAPIKLTAWFGKDLLHIEISAPLGAANIYHVMINNFYEGQLVRSETYGWGIHLHPNTILQGDDVSVIIEMIESGLS